jgi:hypothetical protein
MDDAFPVVVVIGLAIFGIFWIGSQATDGGFSFGEEQPESMLLYSEEPGTIGSSNPDFRTVNFGSFTVGETRGDVQAYTAEKATLSNGLFSGNSVVVNYNATQPGSGEVTFEVLGRQSRGEIYVKVNGNEVFNAATVSGATPNISIPRTSFKNGMNRIVIGTTQPNLLEKAVYSIEDVEVTVEDRKFHDYTDYFEVYDHELQNYRPSNLTFQIPVDASRPAEPLMIKVNDEQVYSQRAGRSIQQARITPQNADLSTGYNTIEFSTDGDSKYRIENAELQLHYSVKTKSADRKMDFELTEDRLNYVQRDNTVETLSFNYLKNTVSEPIEIQLNSAYYTINPENGENTVQLEGSAFQEENTLTLSSNQTFTAQNLQIVSEQEG